MDLLKDAAKNLNLYEVKAYVRKAQNVAMNLTEMESRVREATNNEPWGASTTLMAQISSGTYNPREREEVVGFIFRRFTEKAANEWRQIYKSLQLLEFLIKNGSERIIDDVRSNLPLIQMLKSFHYIDSKGRDQGINVRNRSKNLIALLNDDALIRSERKKAKANANKFRGVSGGAPAASSVGGRTFVGEDDDFSSRVYGDGGVYGERYDDPAAAYANGNSGSNDNFEEYDVSAPSASSKPTTSSSRVNATSTAKPKAKQPEEDLLGDLMSFDINAPSNTKAEVEDDDDDFDDFQAAPSQGTKPNVASNLASLYQSAPQQQQQQQSQQSQQANFFGQQQAQFSSGPSYSINNANTTTTSSAPVKVASSNNDAFLSLFSSAKTKSKTTPTTTVNTANGHNPQDDDLFGVYTSKSATKTTKPAKPAESSTNGDFDLLSF